MEKKPIPPHGKDVCLCVTGRNEAESIGRVIHIIRQLPNSNRFFILAIDDGSTDNTAAVADEAGADHVISRPWRGLGYSVREGYQYAIDKAFDIIINVDADGQHDPGLIPQMVNHLQNGSSVVKCSRFHPLSSVIGTPPEDRLSLNKHFADVISQITNQTITDALCGMFGFKKHVLKVLLPHLKFDEYGLCLEILIKGHALLHLLPLELPHPAIYLADTFRHARVYSQQGKEERNARFTLHEEHVRQALEYSALG